MAVYQSMQRVRFETVTSTAVFKDEANDQKASS
jgi:hypothetical protein